MVAAIGAAAAIGGALITSSAASDASDAQVGASREATAARQATFEQLKGLLQPWINTGITANEGQRKLIGLDGAWPQRDAIAALKSGEEFGALKKVGEEGILANASATGGLRGGNVQGALAQYDTSLLSSLINQQYARLGGLSKEGLAATGQVAGIGGTIGIENANDINSAGAATAGGILGGGRAALGAVNGLTNAAGVFMGGGGGTPVATTGGGIPLQGGFGGGPVFS